MRYILLIIFVASIQSAWAQSLATKCVEETAASHAIGRGTTLTLPDGWRFFRCPGPPLVDFEDLGDRWAAKGGVVIAISSFPNVDKREISEDWIRQLRTKGSLQYVPNSKEKAVNYVSMSRDDIVGGYVSFVADRPDEKPFAVLPNHKAAAVTSFTISHKLVILSISIASGQYPDQDYLDAIEAVRSIK